MKCRAVVWRASPQRRRREVAAIAITATLFFLGFFGLGIAAGERTDAGYGVEVMFGFDNNPLRMPEAGPGGAFSQVGLDGGVSHAVTPRLAFLLDGKARMRFHGRSASGGDFGAGFGRARVAYSPAVFQRNRLVFEAGARYAVYRATYIDRETGEPFEVATAPLITSSIADRLDYDIVGGFAAARWWVGRKLRFYVETGMEKADYKSDYPELGLDSLDFRSFTVEPGVILQLNEELALTFALILTDLDYDNRPALNVSGASVAGTEREYRYTSYQINVLFNPAPRWNLRLGVRDVERSDTFAGYYDYGSRFGYGSVRRQLGARDAVEFYGSYQRLDYETATVPTQPTQPILGSDLTLFLGRYQRGVAKDMSWFVETGLQRTDNQDPLFAYDRDWALTGFQFRR